MGFSQRRRDNLEDQQPVFEFIEFDDSVGQTQWTTLEEAQADCRSSHCVVAGWIVGETPWDVTLAQAINQDNSWVYVGFIVPKKAITKRMSTLEWLEYANKTEQQVEEHKSKWAEPSGDANNTSWMSP